MQNREQKTEKLTDKNRRVARRRVNKQMNTLITPGTVNETMPKTVDPNEFRSEWVTLSNRASLFFWSIDGQDEFRELETYSDAPMPLIDIAGVYIISDKRQKHLRSSVSNLSLSDLSWSSFHFFSLYSQFIVLVCLFILYDLFSYLFSSSFAR